MRRMKLLLCALLGLLTSNLHAADSTAMTLQTYQERMLKVPGLVRYYTFDAADGLFVVDQVAKGQPSVYGINTMTIMSNSQYGNPRSKYVVNATTPYDYPYWTQGRFAGKSALATGLAKQGVVRSQFYGTKTGDLSVMAWVRMHTSSSDKDSGSLLYCGSGWKEGWKISWNRASWALEGALSFEVGTPDGKQTITAKPFAPGIWHCLVATWSKGKMSLYVDGKLAEVKILEQQQIIWPQKSNHAVLGTAYYDVNGMSLGRNNSKDGDCRTDFDELAIFEHALSTQEIDNLYSLGKPDLSHQQQLNQFQQISSQKELLDQIQMTLPADTYGYFQQDQPIEARIVIPPALGLNGVYKAQFIMSDLAGQTVLDQTQMIEVETDHQILIRQTIRQQRCGLYWLDITLFDSKDKVVKSSQYPLAITVPFPAMKDVPSSFPVSAHHMQYVPEHAVLGNKSNRMIRHWSAMERKKGEYNFDYEDEAVALVERMGMDMLFTVDLRPPAWLGKAKDSQNLPADMEELERFLRVLVNRYKGRVKYWEIFNEPNSGAGLKGPNRAKDYVTFLKLAYRIIKEVDPQAKVAAFSAVPRFRWFTEVMNENPGTNYDIVTLHNYGAPPIRLNRERHLIQDVRKLLDDNGRSDVPIWNGEHGYAQPARINYRPIDDQQLLELYAGKLRESYGIQFAPSWMPLTTEYRNACWQSQVILLELALGTERYTSLSGGSHYNPNYNTDDGNPSEKGIAKVMVSSVLLDMQKISRLSLASADQEAILISYKDGKHRLAAFSMEPSALTLAVTQEGTYTGKDYLGNPMSWQTSNGVLQIPISQAPVYIDDVPADINETPIVLIELAQDQLSSNYELKGKLKLRNPWDKPLALDLAMNLPDQTTADIPKTITLKSHEQTSLSFVMQSRDLLSGWYLAQIAATSEQTVLGRADVRFYCDGSVVQVPLATKRIVLDGEINDWPDSAPEGKVYLERQVIRGKPVEGVPGDQQWRGMDDLSFNVKTTWREGEGLYFLLRVTDDQIVTSTDQTQGYLYDGLELFVDTRPGTTRVAHYTLGAQQILVYPQVQTTTQPCKIEYCGNQGNTISVKAQGKRTAKGYIIEGLIMPVPGTGNDFKDGKRLYINFNVNDADSLVSSHLRKSTMSLHNRQANDSISTTRWGAYDLIGQDK